MIEAVERLNPDGVLGPQLLTRASTTGDRRDVSVAKMMGDVRTEPGISDTKELVHLARKNVTGKKTGNGLRGQRTVGLRTRRSHMVALASQNRRARQKT